MSGGGKGGEATVGYKYHLGMHMALCHGPVDNINEIQVDGRVAWTGLSTGGSITVSAENLFGGDKREGGASGTVDIEMGLPSQGVNSYLDSVLTGFVPAFRGVACAVLRQCYMGNNPYLKPWAFRAQRINLKEFGEDQWYPERASVFGRDCEGFDCLSYQEAALALGDSYFPMDDPTYSSTIPAIYRKIDTDNDLGFQLKWGPGGLEGQAWNDSQGPVGSVSLGSLFDSCEPLTVVHRLDPDENDPPGSGFVLNPSPWHSATVPNIDFSCIVIRPPSGNLVFSGARLKYTNDGNNLNSECKQFLHIRRNLVGGNFEYDLEIAFGAFGTPPIVTSSMPDNYFDDGEAHFLSLRTTAGHTTYFDGAEYQLDYTLTYSLVIDDPDSGGIELQGSLQETAATSAQPFTSISWDLSPSSQTFLRFMERSISMAWLGWSWGTGDGAARAELYNAYLRNFEEFTPTGSDCNCLDMNPAHIVREALTESWGLGYLDSDIDDDSFTSCANTLYNEGMGISMLWDREISIEDFIAEVLRYIDAVVYVSRVTGKFVLKLIRDDYDVGSLITIDETNARMATDAKRPEIGELITSVTVNFTDSEQDEEPGSVTVHNEALIQMQGAVNNTKVDYPGFMLRSLASRVSLRDLKSLSTPLLSCDVECNRIAASLNIGSPFILDFPEQGIFEVVMRVDQMSVGDGRDNTVKISCVEDAFSVPNFAVTGDPGDGWVDPVLGTPEESEPRLITESPYYEFVVRVGELNANNILADDPDAGFLYANGGRQGSELNADLMVDSGAGYVDRGTLDFSPYAYLSVDAWYSDDKLYYTGGKDLDLVATGSIAHIGGEIVRVDGFGEDSNGTYVSVGRGCLDTVPAEHEVGSTPTPIIFADPSTDEQQYTASDEVDVKLLTALGSSRLSDATADTVIMDSRAIRPYPPGNLQIDAESYPINKIWDGTHTLTWADRDRLQQTSGTIFDYTEGDIGPEAGTTYTVTADAILDDGSTSPNFIDVDVGSATIWEQDSNTDSNVGSPPFNAEFIRFKVESNRGGYSSWQPAMVVIGFEFSSGQGLWTPAETTTDLWIDWSDSANYTLVSGAYSEVLDKSGNSRSATQTTAGARPAWIEAGQNGLDFARFDGSNDFMALVNFAQVSGQHVFFFGDTTNVGTGYRAFLERSAGTASNLVLLFGSDGENFRPGVYWNGEKAIQPSAVQGKCGLRWNFVTSTSTLTQLNANTPVTGPGATDLTNWSQIMNGGAQQAQVDAYEIVMLPPSATSDDIDRVWGYGMWKWGMEALLPIGFVYKDAPPFI